MANKDDMSIEEILAACRSADGEGGDSEPAAAAPEPAANEPAEAPAPKETPPASGKKPGKMSVAEMMAAARSADAGGGTSEEKAAPVEKPAATAPGKKPGEMSVAEMLAAARAGKSGGAKEEKKAAPKPAAKAKPAAKESKPAAAKAQPTGPKDTASILAAARKAVKPGPMSKAEAAEKGKPEVAKSAKKKLEVPPMPEKPAYARGTAAATAVPTVETRRGFMAKLSAGTGAMIAGSWLAIGFSSLAVTHLLWVLGLARFMFPNILIEPPTKFKVGFPDDFAPGQVATKFKAQFGIWLARYEYEGQPQIYALKSVCTHLGCTPNWLEGEQKFKCPCHGSGFYKDGINFEGPAPRPLERYAISLASDGQLEVDKSRKFNEELGQWKDPASYVRV